MAYKLSTLLLPFTEMRDNTWKNFTYMSKIAQFPDLLKGKEIPALKPKKTVNDLAPASGDLDARILAEHFVPDLFSLTPEICLLVISISLLIYLKRTTLSSHFTMVKFYAKEFLFWG